MLENTIGEDYLEGSPPEPAPEEPEDSGEPPAAEG